MVRLTKKLPDALSITIGAMLALLVDKWSPPQAFSAVAACHGLGGVVLLFLIWYVLLWTEYAVIALAISKCTFESDKLDQVTFLSALVPIAFLCLSVYSWGYENVHQTAASLRLPIFLLDLALGAAVIVLFVSRWTSSFDESARAWLLARSRGTLCVWLALMLATLATLVFPTWSLCSWQVAASLSLRERADKAACSPTGMRRFQMKALR